MNNDRRKAIRAIEATIETTIKQKLEAMKTAIAEFASELNAVQVELESIRLNGLLTTTQSQECDMTLQFKLPEAFKKQWLEDLRSGKYLQGTCLLRFDVKRPEDNDPICYHCCLGVMCDILDPKGWKEANQLLKNRWHNGVSMPDATMVNEKNALVYAAIRQSVPKELNTEGCSTVEGHLAWMNDHGKTFGEIADWIEEHL